MPAQLQYLRDQHAPDTALTFGAESRGAGDCYLINRTDIDFFNLDANRVSIEIKVSNASDRPSLPATATLRVAPFGAFVPWQPLATLSVPALAPGKVVYLRSGGVPARPEALGSPDRVPPRKLLTAFGLADEPPQEPSPQKATSERQPGTPRMPPDLMEMLV